MRKAIKDRFGDVVAIAALIVFALGVTLYILSSQQQPYPSWMPILGDDTYEIKGEFESAQAITPGQGQTVNIAGIEVGNITDVSLEGGKAVVTMLLDEQYGPLVKEDATMLLRPRTGLQDMSVELDVGTPEAEQLEEGSTLPEAQTEGNTQPERFLSSLDGDTRKYLVLLLEGGATGLGGNGEELAATLRRFEPTARDLEKINKGLAERRANVARSINSFRKVSQELGARDTQLTDFVESSDAALQGFANQEAALRETFQELPSTLQATQDALASGDEWALELGPAARRLIPSSKALGPALREVRPFFRQTVGPIREPDPPVHPRGARSDQDQRRGGERPQQEHAPADRLRDRPEPALQRPRVQPAGPGGGLPLLDGLAQPQPEQHLPVPGRGNPVAPRPGPDVLPHRGQRRGVRRDPSLHPHPPADHPRAGELRHLSPRPTVMS